MKNFGAKLLGVTLLLSMSGCSHSPQDAERADISITPAITRVAGLNFELGDKIGLTITRRTGNYVENVPMT
ncbi:MAG: fimbrillin family protein, partial [Alistipes sp.]